MCVGVIHNAFSYYGVVMLPTQLNFEVFNINTHTDFTIRSFSPSIILLPSLPTFQSPIFLLKRSPITVVTLISLFAAVHKLASLSTLFLVALVK